MEIPHGQFLDAMPCCLTVQDRDFRILEANKRFREHFGETDGRFCYQVYKQRAEKCEDCPVEQAFHDGKAHRSEQQVKRLDGENCSVLVEATPIRDGRGRITAVMEMSTDITHMKRMEERLRQSQDRYRLLFEEVPCYISIQDAELNIVDTNRAFREDFGVALGSKCYQTYKHRREACYPCTVRQTFDDGKCHTSEEVVTTRDGERRHVLVMTAPIRDAGGTIVRVMEMSANITQIRELESRLTSLGLLVGSISHGLKGLLNGLTGGMYLIDTGLKKDDRKRLDQGWEIVRRNVTRIKSMVSDILYYVKERTPNWEKLPAVRLATDACKLFKARADEQGVELTSDLDSESGEFEGDAQAVRSLLSNLLENSIDACRLDGEKSEHRVMLRVRGGAEHVRYEVEDNGIGMDPETREKAFSLFFSSKGAEGTGLGLFIANRIATAHGGSIEVESEPGAGTKFIVRFRRRRPESAS